MLTNQTGVLFAVMDVMRQRTEVVKKFGKDRPAAVFLPEGLAQQFWPQFRYHLSEGNQLLSFRDQVADALVSGGQRAVVGRRGGTEPALVNATPLATVSVVVVRVQLQAPSGQAE